MKKTLLSTLILATLSMASAVASAQENPWMVRVRAVNIEFDNKGTAGTAGVWAKDKTIPEVDISYFFTKNIAAELVLTYPQRVDIYAGATNVGHVNALPPSLLLQYHFTNFGQVKPYIGAGINVTHFGRNDKLALASTPISIDKYSVGYAAQVGVDYIIDKHWGVNLDVKYLQIDTKVSGGIGELKLNPVTAGVGVTYKF
jgi:outer membrane protein